MSRPIVFEYQRPGKRTQRFAQWLLHDATEVKVMLMEAHTGPAVAVGERVVLDTGAPAIWFVFPGAWYDIGRFHQANGQFTGWYTNICTPVRVGFDGVWSATDLLLDLWTWPDGSHAWLDEDEFDHAIQLGHVDHSTAARVRETRTELENAMRGDQWPPPIARDFDLATAYSMRGRT